MTTRLKYVPFVNKSNHHCIVCGQAVDPDYWALKVHVDGKLEIIHDNEYMCLETLEVRLGMRKPGFLSSMIYIYQK